MDCDIIIPLFACSFFLRKRELCVCSIIYGSSLLLSLFVPVAFSLSQLRNREWSEYAQTHKEQAAKKCADFPLKRNRQTVGFFWKKHSKNLWFGTKTRKVLSVGRSRLHKNSLYEQKYGALTSCQFRRLLRIQANWLSKRASPNFFRP